MDQQGTFFEAPVDRTPYAALAGVVVSIIVAYTFAAYGLLQLGVFVQQTPMFQGKLPTPDLPSSSSLQDKANGAVEQKKQELEKAAADRAKEEVDKKLNEYLDQ